MSTSIDLFKPEVVRTVFARLDALNLDAPPAWGKMTAGQMLAHCQIPLQTAIGEVKLSRTLIGRLLGRWVKKVILKPEPFKKNSPTDPRFIVKDARNAAEERAKLKKLIERFHALGPGGLTKEPHPFFGAMTTTEWTHLMGKHLDHHLTQFNV